MTERTHYADDATLAYIDNLERELAEARASQHKLAVDYEKLQHDAADWHANWKEAERDLADLRKAAQEYVDSCPADYDTTKRFKAASEKLAVMLAV